MALISVQNLKTYFDTDEGEVKAVDGVSFEIQSAEVFALVGESGCGKSVTAYSILGILPCPPGRIAGGQITFEGQDLLKLTERQMRGIRGAQISMIFQEPMTSLNPVFTCGTQITEAIRIHRHLSGKAAKELAIEMLTRVGIPEPAQRYHEYPHQLSGGMRQRVMIASALSCNPKILIADEPTTALDVTTQAQIIDLLKELQKKENMSMLLITHDLGVVSENADVVAVMYASKLVESADASSLFTRPLHPYTQGLFRSVPQLGKRSKELATIPGAVPRPWEFPSGCKFHTRCSLTRELVSEKSDNYGITTEEGSVRVLRRCATLEPSLKSVQPGHQCACWECPGYNTTSKTN